jgi:hypothetical protein
MAKADRRKHREWLSAAKKGALPRSPKPPKPVLRSPPPFARWSRPDLVLLERGQTVET